MSFQAGGTPILCLWAPGFGPPGEPDGVDPATRAAFKKGAVNELIRCPFAPEELVMCLDTNLRLRDIQSKAATSHELLRKLLPDQVIARLLNGQTLIADHLPSISVLFCDGASLFTFATRAPAAAHSCDSSSPVVGFTSLAASVHTTDLVVMLNELFSAFDALMESHGCYKVEARGQTSNSKHVSFPYPHPPPSHQTIGDCFMAVAGHDGAADHAERVLALAADSACSPHPPSCVLTTSLC